MAERYTELAESMTPALMKGFRGEVPAKGAPRRGLAGRHHLLAGPRRERQQGAVAAIKFSLMRPGGPNP
jgi:hypothetical protein